MHLFDLLFEGSLLMSCTALKKTRYWALAVVLGLVAQSANAATSAYWRHEEGSAGGLIPAGPGTVLDSSGNGNHMKTFDPTFTSATYSTTVSPLGLRSGLSNTLSLDFGPGGDDAGQNDDNYSEGAAVNTQSFTAMTVELAFNMHFVGGWQALLGKDGKPTAEPIPPFKVLIRDDNFPDDIPHQLFIEWIDGDGDIHHLASSETVVANSWYHMAFTLTDSAAELYVADETGSYKLLDSLTGQDFAGADGNVLINDATNFSIGRGMFNNGVADWSNALIDEVRISDVALTRGEFLFVPEPNSLLLASLTVMGLFGRPRRTVH
jgi:hypothetical protein